MPNDLQPLLPPDYEQLLGSLKSRIRSAQLRAALAVNSELVLLYWSIGQDILNRQNAEGWGAKIIDRLANDLRTEFPETRGFSPRNLKYMRAFAEAWPDKVFVQQTAAQIPWFHNCTLLDKVKEPTQRIWYARAAVEYGWSRAVMTHQIESGLYERQGQAITNFEKTLPAVQSDLAQRVTKDPYIFDFLMLRKEAHERELEQGLLNHLRDLLLELGKGFAFVGSQYHIEVGDQDFYLDLVFYHIQLRCWIVIDLKMEDFEPEFAGKMNFYLSAVDDLLRHPDDQPSIGLILCQGRNQTVVEYALRDTAKPIGVAEYRITRQLPESIKEKVPSIEDLREVVDKLRGELEAAQDELGEYRCPVCKAPLSGRSPVELDEHTIADAEQFACGYSSLDGMMEHPCPSDPRFPKLSEYSLTVSESSGQWVCSAIPKTPMARRVHLRTAVGKTEAEARQQMEEQYARSWRPWR